MEGLTKSSINRTLIRCPIFLFKMFYEIIFLPRGDSDYQKSSISLQHTYEMVLRKVWLEPHWYIIYGLHHVKIFFSLSMTGFYMEHNTGLKWFNIFQDFCLNYKHWKICRFTWQTSIIKFKGRWFFSIRRPLLKALTVIIILILCVIYLS